MAGVGIQQLFILIFIFFATQLHCVLLMGVGLDKQTRKQALTLLYILYTVLALITVRSIRFQRVIVSKKLTIHTDAHHFPPVRVHKWS